MRALVLTLVAAPLLCAAAPAVAQPTDTDVKAAFLPRFARYVTWPPAAAPKAGSPFVLCVLGNPSFARLVEGAARSQSVDGRRIVIRNFAAPGAAEGCHIAFIAGNGPGAGQMLAAIGRRPVLTVTDSGSQRGIVHFTVVDGRVRFFIDQAAAQQRGLQISSRLLALAVGVRQ